MNRHGRLSFLEKFLRPSIFQRAQQFFMLVVQGKRFKNSWAKIEIVISAFPFRPPWPHQALRHPNCNWRSASFPRTSTGLRRENYRTSSANYITDRFQLWIVVDSLAKWSLSSFDAHPNTETLGYEIEVKHWNRPLQGCWTCYRIDNVQKLRMRIVDGQSKSNLHVETFLAGFLLLLVCLRSSFEGRRSDKAVGGRGKCQIEL